MRKSFFRKIKFIIYRRGELKKNKILCPNSAPAHGPCLENLVQAQCPEKVKEGI
jgi:hypothetical protein